MCARQSSAPFDPKRAFQSEVSCCQQLSTDMNRYYTACPFALWISHGFSMIFPWIVYEFSMDFLWVFHRFSMTFPWMFYEFSMDFLWMFYELFYELYECSIDFLWTFYGFAIDCLWNFYGCSMDFLWIFDLCQSMPRAGCCSACAAKWRPTPPASLASELRWDFGGPPWLGKPPNILLYNLYTIYRYTGIELGWEHLQENDPQKKWLPSGELT